jgi:excisionase family DNA binding protein
MQENFLSISEAAKLTNVTRQAIYVAIKHNRLNATKNVKKWRISLEDLKKYRENRYSRAFSLRNGKRIYDVSQGTYSIGQAAKLLGVPPQKIYYATRQGVLKSHREGCAWVINEPDLIEYEKTILRVVRKSRAS